MELLDVDTVIVGAGIAGASLAWQLAQQADPTRVLLLERESQPGMHSTGRSAAMWMPSYGPPAVRALTRAAGAFYAAPPPGFTDVPLLPPRGVLYVAAPGQEAALDDLERELTPCCAGLLRLDAAATLARAPWLRADQLIGSLWDPESTDIDVHALHQGYLRGFRRTGGQLRCDAELVAAQRDGHRWQLQLADGTRINAAVLVNAAGAWGDVLAARCGAAPVGLVPRRRSAFTFRGPAGADTRAWPLVASVDAEGEGWYVKPDAGQLLGSPANADDTVPQDVRPEELDIALAVHRIETATTLTVGRPTATWAGLRSFVPDGELVIGFDDACPGFFWLVGQGGYGIQSAAGAAALAAALLSGAPLPAGLVDEGVDPAALAVQRLRG
ncbi:NAD(P)/FAD-dependent oxidoreductase [Pseudaquabacterium pictum]|uniref:FAD-dependent catabolic D-arginine dehydrogenase DauA n=1 Tax=Pseudaquabacterium pictum TaxID=2315236 RepID=A0A480AT03_9BURK|nr:FAD-dependent oxidoreductase [Rubrivivax pictus]GCL62865.1 FAD-dependent catabolic D-arginine dehydrogenase DauA [Rubrivivax pictus]